MPTAYTLPCATVIDRPAADVDVHSGEHAVGDPVHPDAPFASYAWSLPLLLRE